MKRIFVAIAILTLLVSGCGQFGDPIPEDLYTRNIYPGHDSVYNIGANGTEYFAGYFDHLYVGDLAVCTGNCTGGGGGAPAAHAATHENGGADEINVNGLSGHLADLQDPVAHNHALAGDVTGTTDASVVGDDSHNHTGATLSGIDISGDTNLSTTLPITLIGDTVGIDQTKIDHSKLGNLTWTTAGHTIDGDVNFAGYEAAAMLCDKGTAFPGAPALGQWFLHTPTGRNFLYQYDGSTWVALASIGTTTIYVDGGAGTDGMTYGTGTGANAFATIQYAINMIPPLFIGDVTVNVAAGTYAELVTIKGKTPGGNYYLYLVGNRNHSHYTATGGTAGTGATRATVVCAGGTFPGVNSEQYKFARFDDSTTTVALRGVIRPITNNTTTTLTVAGTWDDSTPAAAPPTPVNGDTFEVFTLDSIISGSGVRTTALIIGGGQTHIIIRYIDIENTTSYSVDNEPYGKSYMYAYSSANFQGCKIDNASGLWVGLGNTMHVYWCIIKANYNVVHGGIATFWNSVLYLKTASPSSTMLIAFQSASIGIKSGTTLRGDTGKTGNGISSSANSQVYTSNSNNEGQAYIAGFGNGIYCYQVSVATGTATNNYTDNDGAALSNTINENAVAASYGYID